MNSFVFTNAVKNIFRQRRRYAVFGILILLSAGLSVFVLSVVAPARMYAADMRGLYGGAVDMASEEYAFIREAEQLNSTLSLMQAGILVVGGVALAYVSSMVVNERLYDAGVLYAIGLDKSRLFVSFLTEILVFCAAVIAVGSVIGYTSAYVFLCLRIEAGSLEEEIMTYFRMGSSTFLIVAVVAFLLILLPVAQLSLRVAKSSPVSLLKERK